MEGGGERGQGKVRGQLALRMGQRGRVCMQPLLPCLWDLKQGGSILPEQDGRLLLSALEPTGRGHLLLASSMLRG